MPVSLPLSCSHFHMYYSLCHNAYHTSQLQFGLSAGTYASWSLIGRDQFENPTYFIAGLSDSRDLYTQPFTQASAELNTTVSNLSDADYYIHTLTHTHTHTPTDVHTWLSKLSLVSINSHMHVYIWGFGVVASKRDLKHILHNFQYMQ